MKKNLLIVFLLLTGPVFSQSKPPNIIFILADDLGWGDLSCYGNRTLNTPNLDRLARQGALFTQFYVASPVCSPSRSAFMTGRFPASDSLHGHLSTEESNGKRSMANFLNPDLPTLPRQLQKAGYRTGMFGKWHLGHSAYAPLPEAYGFDASRTNTSNDTTDFKLWYPENRPNATKMVLDEAMQFIEKNKDQPFYVNAWLVDAHALLSPCEEQLKLFERFSPKPYARQYYDSEVPFYGAPQIYYAAVTEMDRQIGLFLNRLEKLGLAENTIVIFSSDNGPEVQEISNASHSAAGSNGPFRGRKRSIYEGGIRVPLLIRYPNHIPSNTIDSTSVLSAVDFLPTLLTAAKVPVPKEIDGEAMPNILKGLSQVRQRPLFWEWRFQIFGHVLDRSPMLAVRDGKWKLLMNPDRSRIELYNLEKDPSELDNHALRQSSITEKLSKKVLAWHKRMPSGATDPRAGDNTYNFPR